MECDREMELGGIFVGRVPNRLKERVSRVVRKTEAKGRDLLVVEA